MVTRSVRCLFAVALAAGLSAAKPSAREPFQEQARTARIWITALAKGEPVTDLIKEDLDLSIGKQQRTIARLTLNPPEPLSLKLVCDISGSRTHELPGIEDSVGPRLFKLLLRPGDRGSVIAFNDRVYHSVGPTDRQDLLSLALYHLAAAQPRGGTALYDALYAALRPDSVGAGSHQGLVVVTDGDDNASHYSLDAVRDALLASGYFVEPVRREPGDEGSFRVSIRKHTGAERLEKVARGTGGAYFEALDEAGARHAFDSIAALLRAQYALDFQPTVALRKKASEIRIRCRRKGVKMLAPEQYE